MHGPLDAEDGDAGRLGHRSAWPSAATTWQPVRVTSKQEPLSQPAPGRVVLATAADIPAITASLADAFMDDPVMSWVLRDEGSRRVRLARMFAVMLRGHYIELGAVWTTAERDGAALWAPPGQAVIPLRTTLRFVPSLVRALGRETIRGLGALTHVEKQHPKDPHWYLGVLGTRAAMQGKGVGSRVLHPVLEKCDREGIPAFLESSKHSNIAFYRRFGFEVTGEIPLPNGGPTVWPMWRDPQPPAAGEADTPA